MKKGVIIFLIVQSLTAQNYQVGHRSVVYTDPARNNRQIQTEFYYPASTSGDNVPIANGQFPYMVFAHGFVMSWDSYKWLWDSLVPLGYIMAFPRTEGGLSPNHLELAKDLRFLNEKILSENNNPSSFLYQKVKSKSAIMGHSMGGGCSFLAAENYTNFTTLINFAAAVTNPSSITAAKQVTVPLLMFIGENDGVTPPTQHQIPMYDSCASSCKTRVTIKGGGHCYFANYNFNCSFGEMTTNPQPTIDREEQFKRVMYLLKPYVDFMLKENSASEQVFLSRLANNPNITYVRDCQIDPPTFVLPSESNEFFIFPNPFENELFFRFDESMRNFTIRVYNIMGKLIVEKVSHTPTTSIIFPDYALPGIYIVHVFTGERKHVFVAVKK